MGWYVLSTALMLCILEKRIGSATGRQKTQPGVHDESTLRVIDVIDVT
jgi:hypothetical protein